MSYDIFQEIRKVQELYRAFGRDRYERLIKAEADFLRSQNEGEFLEFFQAELSNDLTSEFQSAVKLEFEFTGEYPEAVFNMSFLLPYLKKEDQTEHLAHKFKNREIRIWMERETHRWIVLDGEEYKVPDCYLQRFLLETIETYCKAFISLP